MSKHPIVHVEFSAKDRKEAAKFYSSVFGWEMQHVDEMNYTNVMTGQEVPGGGLNPVGENVPAGTVTVYIGTDDIDSSLKAVESNGGKALVPKTEIPGFGWFAHFQDPTGNVIGLWTELPR